MSDLVETLILEFLMHGDTYGMHSSEGLWSPLCVKPLQDFVTHGAEIIESLVYSIQNDLEKHPLKLVCEKCRCFDGCCEPCKLELVDITHDEADSIFNERFGEQFSDVLCRIIPSVGCISGDCSKTDARLQVEMSKVQSE